MPDPTPNSLPDLLAQRYSDPPQTPDVGSTLNAMAAHASCRKFQSSPPPLALLETLCAVALAAPTKSDLQQRDIIIMSSPTAKDRLVALMPGQPWVAQAPMILVFCGNNRRQRLLHDWHHTPFANDHLDAFFNATVDGAIALGAFVAAAQTVGLGCCPISAIRNDPHAISHLLSLPDHVFPVAGLAVGYPAETAPISKRLPLSVTLHQDHYSETALEQNVQAYDQARATAQPYTQQRFTNDFGTSPDYAWSDDKTRQYSRPERASFGAFIRAKGFRLD